MSTIAEILSYAELTSDKQAKLEAVIEHYEEALDLAYEIVSQLLSGLTVKQILNDCKQNNFSWKSTIYKEYEEIRDKKDAILANPPEVREGEIECPKCKSRKTVTIETQSRSADEGFTYYIHCFNPKCKAITK